MIYLVYISVNLKIRFFLVFEPTTGIEPVTFSLPRKRSTPELRRRSSKSGILFLMFFYFSKQTLYRFKTYFSVLKKLSGRRDSNPRHSAWKAEALPTELLPLKKFETLSGERRIRTSEACAADLQSALVGHLSISPYKRT